MSPVMGELAVMQDGKAVPLDVETAAEIRHCCVLIVDIAGSVEMRSQLGDAAAGRRIRHLLDAIVDLARRHHGEFIKSYGDDVLAIFEKEAVGSAATVAIAAQRLAAKAGLQLYAGLHAGDVEFRETMGHPDALGLTVNVAARLHKLTEGAPGRIFLAEESVHALPPALAALASRYGTRTLKGVGAVGIWTLDWYDTAGMQHTAFTIEPENVAESQVLLLRSGEARARLDANRQTCFAGRSKECALIISDPESRISSTHLLFERDARCWFVQDISRNGTWLRDGGSGAETLLPSCTKVMLPRSGMLCLGRPFAEDPEGRYTVTFG
ncbi:MAG: adenylate/guanylate cyclase domain-containing protein [Nevskiales bacterium]